MIKMVLYLRSHSFYVIASAIIATIPVLIFCGRNYHVLHPSGNIIFPLSLPLSFATVFILTLGFSGSYTYLENSSAKNPMLLRLYNILLLFILGLAATLIITFITAKIYPHHTTLGYLPLLKAYLGFFGIACIAEIFLDRRIAGLTTIPFAVIGIIFDTNNWNAPYILSFVFVNSQNSQGLLIAWHFAALLCITGITLQIVKPLKNLSH